MTTLPTVQEKPATSQPKRSQDFNTAKALELRFKGLTYEQIGAALDPEQPYTPQTVQGHLQRFQRFIENPQDITAFESSRSQLLSAMEFELLRSLADETCLSKASLNNRAYAFQQIFNARRLESGKSTENLGVLGKLVVEAAGEVFKKDPLITKGKSETVD